MSNTVLVIAAHPDDEILGCGGAMGMHATRGDEIHVLILAEGLTSRDAVRNRTTRQNELSALAETAKDANSLLGAASVTLHDFPDNRMDSLPRLEVVKIIEESIRQIQPDTVYTHHCGDVNVDHRRVHDAVITACRPMPGHRCVKTLLFFEVASSTEWQPPGSAPPFTPDWFIDISSHLDQKLKALEIYAAEMRPWPHARSVKAVEHLARWRGANIGVDAAEAFKLGRRLEQ